MNCKQGDLAVVVRCLHPEDSNFIGSVVSCKETEIWCGRLAWLTPDHPLVASVFDECLRPIRPDETPEESLEAMKLLTQTKEKV